MEDYNDKKIRYKFYRSKPWRELREQVLKRANYECEFCKAEGKVTTTNLEIDHIKTVEEFPQLRLDPDNLRVLCHSCHDKRHNRFGRWQKKPNKWDGDEKW
ncbi:HNH endonuclease [Staphylococcus caprae]|nr:HNH endonuclease signature motif containing protein [Staphylococcus caprae]MCI2955629.1 HNH endonuclease [Staphylococcus caprae]